MEVIVIRSPAPTFRAETHEGEASHDENASLGADPVK